MVGRTILQYQLIEKLGAGGMGEIYKARDTRLNRIVAVKVLPAGNADADYRRRFIHEAQAASGLNHPNIITIHDIVSLGDEQFMIMEFVNGKTLGELIGNNGLDVAGTLRYAVQIAEGLGTAHEAGIVHRDLKPGNIMVTAAGLVKILDFGLAKFTDNDGPVSLTDSTRTLGPAPATVRGTIVGTVNYMSPEQAQGGKLDARSDIFSFGCVLYEMLTGRKAFAGESALLTLTAILRDEPRPIGASVAAAPAEFAALVERALRKDPAQRWQSVQEMRRELLAIKQRQDSAIFCPPPATAPVAQPVRAKKSASNSFVAGIAIALLLLGLPAAWWWTRNPAGHPAIPFTPGFRKPKMPAQPKPSAFLPGTLNNQAIIDMAQGHVPESVIISHIRSSQTNFDLSTAQLIKLAKAGVTEAVIHAMRDPNANVRSARDVQVIGGTGFEIALLDDVSADCKAGQPLRFQAVKDVAFGGVVVVPQGALVTGAITEAAKKKFLVHATRPTFRLDEVTAADGSKLRIRAVPGHLGESRKDPPFEPIGGTRAKDAVARAGSRFIAYFDGDQVWREAAPPPTPSPPSRRSKP